MTQPWTQHLDKILAVLTVILAAAELEHFVPSWVVLASAILTAISEFVKPSHPSLPAPEPQKGK
jgi:hypothetical protein